MTFGYVFSRIFGFIPQVVMEVETLAGQGTGQSKKSAALGLILSAADVAGAIEGVDVSAAAPALQSAIGGIIDATVALLNAFGIFSHKPAPAPSATAPAPAASAPAASSAAPAPTASSASAFVSSPAPATVIPAAARESADPMAHATVHGVRG